MARTTRSTMAQEKDKTQETPPQTRKGQNKKRKRTSNANEAEQPVTKVTRTQDAVKVEDSQEAEELQVEGVSEPEPPSSGDVPLHEEDAEKILEVLETCVPHSHPAAVPLSLFVHLGLTHKVYWTEYSHCQQSIK